MGAALLAVINIGHVVIFAFVKDNLNPEEHTWALWVLATHAAMLLPMVAAARLAGRWRTTPSRWAAALPLAIAVCVLAFGMALTLIDQAVTPAISAYVNACMGVALVFLLRPWHALLLYLTGALVAVSGLAWVSPYGEAMRLNAQANIASASLMAFMVSVLLWRTFARAELLQRQLSETNATLLAQQTQLAQLATQDPLTSLLNRRAWLEQAHQAMRRAQRDGAPMSLLLCDLDHFKHINDEWGHPAGDAVLVDATQRLTQGVRATDWVGRWGGEEFIVLLPNTGGQQARILADKLRLAQALATTHWMGHELQVTVSGGVATWAPGDTHSLEELVALADQALYQAKRQGRNQVVQATSAPGVGQEVAPTESAEPTTVNSE